MGSGIEPGSFGRAVSALSHCTDAPAPAGKWLCRLQEVRTTERPSATKRSGLRLHPVPQVEQTHLSTLGLKMAASEIVQCWAHLHKCRKVPNRVKSRSAEVRGQRWGGCVFCSFPHSDSSWSLMRKDFMLLSIKTETMGRSLHVICSHLSLQLGRKAGEGLRRAAKVHLWCLRFATGSHHLQAGA